MSDETTIWSPSWGNEKLGSAISLLTPSSMWTVKQNHRRPPYTTAQQNCTDGSQEWNSWMETVWRKSTEQWSEGGRRVDVWAEITQHAVPGVPRTGALPACQSRGQLPGDLQDRALRERPPPKTPSSAVSVTHKTIWPHAERHGYQQRGGEEVINNLE